MPHTPTTTLTAPTPTTRPQSVEASTQPWPDREPLGTAPTKPGPLDVTLIPAALRDYCVDTAQRLGVPVEQILVPTLISAASLTGATSRLQMKRQDTAFRVPANLYGANVGEPSTKKTAAIAAGTTFLMELEQQRLAEHDAERLRRSSDMQALEARIEGVKKALQNAQRNAKPIVVTELTDKHRALREEQAKLDPPAPRLQVSNATPEALTQRLAENPRGLLSQHDELNSLFMQMSKPGFETMRTLLLQSWNGLPITEDRVGRGTTHIKAATLSLIGGIQPATLRAAMPKLNSANGEDGFFARMQLMVWVHIDDLEYDSDHAPDKAAQQRARNTFAQLDRRASERQAAINEGGEPEVFTLTDDAYEHMTAYRRRLQDAAKQAVKRGRHLYAAHLGKTAEVAGRVALNLHLIDAPTGAPAPQVTLTTVQRATALMDYFLQHAHLTYGLHLHPEHAVIESIAHQLETGDLHGKATFTLAQKVSAVKTVARAERLLQYFIDRNWLRLIKCPTSPSRSKRLMVLHPDLRHHTDEETDGEEYAALDA